MDFEHVKAVIDRLIAADSRILKEPAPMVALSSLSASSVDIKVRAWTKVADYWDVYFDFNKAVYETFNKEGIGFPAAHRASGEGLMFELYDFLLLRKRLDSVTEFGRFLLC